MLLWAADTSTTAAASTMIANKLDRGGILLQLAQHVIPFGGVRGQPGGVDHGDGEGRFFGELSKVLGRHGRFRPQHTRRRARSPHLELCFIDNSNGQAGGETTRLDSASARPRLSIQSVAIMKLKNDGELATK